MNRSQWLLGLSISLGLLVTVLVASAPASGATTEIAPLWDSHSPVSGSGRAASLGTNQLPPMAPGIVLVALKPGAVASSDRPALQAGDSSLSTAFASIGVRSIEPVFPHTARRHLVASASDTIDLGHVYRLHLALDADVLAAAQVFLPLGLRNQ